MSERLGWGGALFVLGAIIGSFVATLVVRWLREESVVRGRSRCDACGTVLTARDLVPLASAAWRRGACRTCRAPIDPWHWRIELLCALVGGSAGLVVGGPWALAGCVFGWLLVALAALDVAAFWLPDRLAGALAAAGLCVGLARLEPPLVDRLIGAATGFALLWVVAAGYRRVRGREGLGGGDPKLFGAIGLWLGWRLLPAVLVVAGMIGLGAVAVARIGGRALRRDDPLPLGALLAAAAYPAWLILIGGQP